ncbi:hypothetical protein MMYC01_200622 [Madurella mycetomatis]|uniref:Uncharacterized protein n=1 Tax=Madurella mycetomatis TaxID=100816 RepID=A0A175WGL7_9PEZI|nr:hypothetical protein MMYC01_200622 [Madurella mycetomatis]
MHPAPNLAEAPPNKSPAPIQHRLTSPETNVAADAAAADLVRQLDGTSTPVRQDTTSSTSTTATSATLATIATNETPGTPYSVDASPTSYGAQGVFSARDGSNMASQQRRANRRRTGPLTAAQRERAHLIRKMGACNDCRKRRVACHPNHHDMTWEEAARKFKLGDSSMQAFAQMAGSRLSPAPLNANHTFTQDSQAMDLDVSASQPIQHGLAETRISRTPLPSAPRPEKTVNMAPVPGWDSFRADLQGSADRILANSFRSRYAAVSVLMVQWQDDEDAEAKRAVQELGKVFGEEYKFSVQIKSIPTSSDDGKKPWIWLSRTVADFIENPNQRDVLHIFYYSGHSYLDGERDMVLASPKQADRVSAIRWSMIQQFFENARSDALLIMDCAYYPSYKTVRQQGMLELIAASAGEDHIELLGRSTFTRNLTDQLRRRVAQRYKEPFSAAELHSKLLSLYPHLIRERNPEKELIASFPTPLGMQLSGLKTLPSVLVAPLRSGEPPPSSPESGSHLTLTFRLEDNSFHVDSWAEWLRLMPQGIREVRVEGPYRNTLR